MTARTDFSHHHAQMNKYNQRTSIIDTNDFCQPVTCTKILALLYGVSASRFMIKVRFE